MSKLVGYRIVFDIYSDIYYVKHTSKLYTFQCSTTTGINIWTASVYPKVIHMTVGEAHQYVQYGLDE